MDLHKILRDPIILFVIFVVIIFIVIKVVVPSASEDYIAMDSGTGDWDGDWFYYFKVAALFGVVGLFILFFIIYVYYYKLDLWTSFKESLYTLLNIPLEVVDKIGDKIEDHIDDHIEDHVHNDKEVFNIPNNIYNYDDARAICKSFDADLATYDQIEDAYNKGASWCAQGWSEGQNIFFPTQKEVFNKLQGIKGHEHDCGRPGINGGYIEDASTYFGVNCYGKKPAMKEDDRILMENKPLYPVNEDDADLQSKVDYWKKRLDDVIVSPFNPSQWND